MDRKDAIKLFKACQAKKAKALQAGDSEEKAQAAAAAHWNTEWADPLITRRKELEEAGTWQTEERWDQARGPSCTIGKNDVTREILAEACVDFSTINFSFSSSPGTSNKIVCKGSKISFQDFHFPGDISFKEVTFEGTANFWFATFGGTADFFSAKFEGNASFQRTKFEGNASFQDATFKRTAYFSGAEFHGPARFGAIHCEWTFNLADCKFFRFVPDFIQAHFIAPPRLDHMEFPSVRFCSKALIPLSGADIKKNKKDDENEVTENDIARYYTLRRIAIEGKDQTTERVAFKAEMRARRGMYKWKDTPTRVVSYLYDLISDFGSSFMRPALFWTAQLILVAIIYQCMATEDVQCPYCPAAIISHVSRDALQLSAAQTLPFLITSQHLDFTKAYRRLYGVEQSELLSSFGIVSTLHALFSVLWLFLILLALRNLFKIR